MTIRYIRKPHYEDEDDCLNYDVSPLADLVEIITISLREMFGARSAGNYRWVGGVGENTAGEPQLSELAITESAHKIPELMDRLPAIVVGVGGSRNTGLELTQGNIPNPVTGEVVHSDLIPTNLIFRACSTVGTEAIRLAEYAKGYFLLFREFFMERANLHDVAGNISVSQPIPTSQVDGSSGKTWTEVIVSIPIQVRFFARYDYSQGSAFRPMRDRVILAIESRLEGPFSVVESGE
jgi:hypothetical protein